MPGLFYYAHVQSKLGQLKRFYFLCPRQHTTGAYIDMSIAIDESRTAFFSTKEVASTLAGLSTADLLRVKQIAKLRCVGLSAVTWEDLLSEAVTRSLAGTRRWPRAVPFIAFLAQTIRSIASEEWRRLDHEQTTLETDLNVDDGDTPIMLADLAVDRINPEREVIARKTLSDIETLFRDDNEASAILRGFADGATPEQIQSSASLTPTQYASAQKRIRRRLARNFAEKED